MDQKIQNGDYEEITSVVVSQKGKIIFEEYYQGNDSASLHNTRSATKTLASILTGIAIQKGFIKSEQDPIMMYLKDKKPNFYPDPRKEKITIEDVLTMSSILECDDNTQVSRGQEEKMYIMEDWTQFFLDLPIQGYPEWYTKPEDSPYGRSWRYCSAGPAALAEVIQNAVGEPLDVFAQTNLFGPLGFGTYELSYTPTGIINTAGGNHIRSRDFLKLAELYLNDGKVNGQQIVSPEWIAKSTTPKAHAYDDFDYGYLFWLNESGVEGNKHSAFFMSGNGGNKVVGIQDLDLAIVITTTNYNNRNAHGYSHEMIDEYIVPWVAQKK